MKRKFSVIITGGPQDTYSPRTRLLELVFLGYIVGKEDKAIWCPVSLDTEICNRVSDVLS